MYDAAFVLACILGASAGGAFVGFAISSGIRFCADMDEHEAWGQREDLRLALRFNGFIDRGPQ